ncbi:MAG TPA: hypothetical protein VIE39_02620 [Thermoanaerobaculia bacterium]|jgi:hypothetical protein
MNTSAPRPPWLSVRAALAAGGLLLWAATAAAQRPGPIPTDRGIPSAPRVRVLKTWQDTIKLESGEEIARRVELSYDYDRGLATVRAFDEKGALLSEQTYERGPRPTAEEMQEAVGLLQADRQIGAIMRSRSAVVEGGFLLSEKPGDPCGPRTRCLQVQLLSPDRVGLIRWSVVDLNSRRIVYPVYVPSPVSVKQ